MSSFGHFSSNGTEYIFTDPETKRPMMNYIWNSRILSGFNQFGSGQGAYGNRAASYIDSEGRGRAILLRNGFRYFYIRDEESGEFWCPGWFPVKKKLDFYECCHGLGYTRIDSIYKGIKASLRFFVNETDPVEICTVRLENLSGQKRRIKCYSAVEFSLEGYERYSEYDSYVSTEFIKEANMVVAHNNAQERPHSWYDGFIASSRAVSGFDSSLKSFIGDYGDVSAPETVVKGSCTNSLAASEKMAGVLENDVTLEPGLNEEFHILTGSTDSADRALKMAENLFKPGHLEQMFNEVLASRKEMINHIRIDTPDDKVNHIINSWIKQQIQLCAEAGRATGKGFRDQLQDSWAISSFNENLAAEKILETLRHQFSDGSCVRGWLPIDEHIYSDGPVWIAPAINDYIKETGDFDFLEIQVPYLDEGSATVWEHILLAARHSSTDLGAHELVLARDGDWNDSLNGIGVGGRGESVWTSIALHFALLNTAELARDVCKDESIYAEMITRAEKIKKAVNEAGWDGQWYLAGYDDDGEKVGTQDEEEGRIYLNSQTWAVLSGIADNERIEKSLNAVDKYLDSPYGPLTLYPPYTSYNKSIGRLTGFIPGIWENGTPYCHGGTFKIVADCILGRGNQAYETLKKIMPDSDLNPSEHSGCEPYVFTNMYFGPDHLRAGETSFAWVTGTAGWIFRSVTRYMMGFHPGYNSFKIQPCLPDDWESCSLKRDYRGDIYLIDIKKRKKGRNTVKQIILDGKEIQGNEIPIIGDGKEHLVSVLLD